MKLKQNSPRHLVVLGLVVAGVLLGCAQSVTAQWSPNANPTPTPGTNIYYNSGNVGIGTTSPVQKLDVNGSIQTSGDLQISGSNVLKWLSNDAGAVRIYTFSDTYGIGTSNTNGDLSLFSGGGGGITFTHGGVNATPQMRIDSSGNVGIGTPTPGDKLHVEDSVSGVFNALRLRNSGGGDNQSVRLNFAPRGNFGDDVYIDAFRGTVDTVGFTFHTYENAVGGRDAMVITGAGNVGIGTSPTQKLSVAGNINVTPTGTEAGDITLSGTIHAKYQDVAEWVPASEQLAAGTVVVLDSTKSNQVTESSVSYDTRVAGVISAQPGIALGEKSDTKVLVATTGRVKVKVDASKSPIHIGDLLVTSDVPGVAMKSEAVSLGGVQFHRPGTLIGKALEPLSKGTGTILVLLSLQ